MYTFIIMRTSEGSEALWLQCGGQEVTLSLSCFLLGVVDGSSSTTAPPTSPESAATGLPRAFTTRSYLLFHSRRISAGVTCWENRKAVLAWCPEGTFHHGTGIFFLFICNMIPTARKSLQYTPLKEYSTCFCMFATYYSSLHCLR